MYNINDVNYLYRQLTIVQQAALTPDMQNSSTTSQPELDKAEMDAAQAFLHNLQQLTEKAGHVAVCVRVCVGQNTYTICILGCTK
jgi:hypothetical protein